MSATPHLEAPVFRKRTKLFVGHGFQLRYGLLVAGSLTVLLLFSGVHGYFVAHAHLPDEAWALFQGPLLSSTVRLFLVGLIYIGVISLAALFLTHRTVGPAHRLEEEMHRMATEGGVFRPLDVRDGDEFAGLARAVNGLVAGTGRQVADGPKEGGA